MAKNPIEGPKVVGLTSQTTKAPPKLPHIPMPRGPATVLSLDRTPQAAYTQGSRAFLKGRDDTNPHPAGELADCWARGYQDTASAHRKE